VELLEDTLGVPEANNKLTDTDIDELCIVIGLIIATGVVSTWHEMAANSP
jgi:hypothetical protein